MGSIHANRIQPNTRRTGPWRPLERPMFDHFVRTSAPRIGRLAGLIFCCQGLLPAQAPVPQPSLTERERALLDRVESLEKKVAALEARLPAAAAPAAPSEVPRSSVLGGAATGAAAAMGTASTTQSPDATKPGILGLSG